MNKKSDTATVEIGQEFYDQAKKMSRERLARTKTLRDFIETAINIHSKIVQGRINKKNELLGEKLTESKETIPEEPSDLTRLEERMGEASMSHGFVAVPRTFMLKWKDLGLSRSERDLVMYVLSQEGMTASNSLLAEMMQISLPRLKSIKHDLLSRKWKRRRLVRVMKRDYNPHFRKWTQYDFTNLWAAAQEVYEMDILNQKGIDSSRLSPGTVNYRQFCEDRKMDNLIEQEMTMKDELRKYKKEDNTGADFPE